MDEIQVQNRMADLPELFKIERHNTALAMWGSKSNKGGGGGGSGRTRG
jgi:hypothetical protein